MLTAAIAFALTAFGIYMLAEAARTIVSLLAADPGDAAAEFARDIDTAPPEMGDPLGR